MIGDLLIKARSYRKFDENHEIDYNDLMQVVENLRFIASARNQQVLRFRIITDRILREKIFPCLKWAGYLKDWDGPAEGERPTAYIIIAFDKNRIKFNDNFKYVDLGIAIEAISLQLAERNLGCCTIAAFNKNKISSVLNVEKFIDIQAIMAIGKPNQDVRITEVVNDDIKYFVKNSVHFVPKRMPKDIIF